MPTVLRAHGFRISILFPPREHPPAHVHVWNATGEVVIVLARDGRPQSVRNSVGMSGRDVRRAERIVAENQEVLLETWRQMWEP